MNTVSDIWTPQAQALSPQTGLDMLSHAPFTSRGERVFTLAEALFRLRSMETAQLHNEPPAYVGTVSVAVNAAALSSLAERVEGTIRGEALQGSHSFGCLVHGNGTVTPFTA